MLAKSSVSAALALSLVGVPMAMAGTDAGSLGWDLSGSWAMRLEFVLPEDARVELHWAKTVPAAQGERASFVQWHWNGAPFSAFAAEVAQSTLGDAALGAPGMAVRANPEQTLHAAASAEGASNGLACSLAPPAWPGLLVTPCALAQALDGSFSARSGLVVDRAPAGRHVVVVVPGGHPEPTATRFEAGLPGATVTDVAFAPSHFLTHRSMAEGGIHASARGIGYGALASVGTAASFHVGHALYGFAYHRPAPLAVADFALEGPAGRQPVEDVLLFEGSPPGDYRATLTALDVGEWGRYGVLWADLPPMGS